jgi:hypothetical protein
LAGTVGLGEAAGFGAAPVWAKAGEANSAQASRIDGRNLCDSLCDTKAPLNMCMTAKPEPGIRASRMRHVGSSLFAVMVCRKFASAAAFSWHLPHHKNAAAMNRWVCALSCVSYFAFRQVRP